MRFAPPEFGRQCWNNGVRSSRTPTAFGNTSTTFTSSVTARVEMSSPMPRYSCFLPKPGSSPDASSRSAVAPSWDTDDNPTRETMPPHIINKISARDARFPLPQGAGTDSVHTNSEYCLAVTLLESEGRLCGTGIALTLGEGNRLVCEAIELLARPLTGMVIEELMSDFGRMSRRLSDDPSLRWLGPHKGVVHLALASITNACFDLWAKSRQEPLWKLLIDLTAAEVVRLLDLSYLEDVLGEADALELLREPFGSRAERKGILKTGYPGYDTSVGWIAYDDTKVKEL